MVSLIKLLADLCRTDPNEETEITIIYLVWLAVALLLERLGIENAIYKRIFFWSGGGGVGGYLRNHVDHS